MSESRIGGWTTYSPEITAEANKVFNTAMEGLVGMKYSPVAFASQITSGTNYCFFCNAKCVFPGAVNDAAMVSIYQPPGELPHVIETKRIKH